MLQGQHMKEFSVAVSLKDELLRSGNVMFTNKGVSMRPLLREGRDVMIIEKRTPDTALSPGMAVLFERFSGDLVLHRIYRKKGNGFLILGDNCINPEYVEDERIIGILTGVVRDGKKMVNVTDKGYQRYVKLWTASYPVRRLFLKAKNKFLNKEKQ